MISMTELRGLVGHAVIGTDGAEIGPLHQVYFDDETHAPEWITVQTGRFGAKESFVPLEQARAVGDHIEVPFDKKKVKDAPKIAPDDDLTRDEEAELYRYYGTRPGGGQPAAGQGAPTPGTVDPGAVGRDISGPTTDDAMTRSEEHLVAGKRTEQTGRARLRKYVVTEEEQVSVPVTREEAYLEREPITESNVDKAMAGPEISEEEHEVTLYAERPVVGKETTPVERVRVGKESVTEQESVRGEVRKEQIEYEEEQERRPGDDR